LIQPFSVVALILVTFIFLLFRGMRNIPLFFLYYYYDSKIGVRDSTQDKDLVTGGYHKILLKAKCIDPLYSHFINKALL
jgi:hypothetical protein